MNVLQSTYDELKAECDALAIKAARYDWLRISADISWNGWVTHSMLAATDAERAELDSAIDSAMASSGYEVNTRHGAGDAEDAARYRWLRAEHAANSPLAHVCWKKNGDRECGEWTNTAGPDSLDAAIDAARAGERG